MAQADPAAWNGAWVRGLPNVQNTTIYEDYFGQDAILLIEGGILHPS